ncbi:MAG: hypothetical protein VYD50_03415 [Candidatus Thermoplasmatota archaeon]|nr:hypothetical protein [Candidatus Thermoplasmatota archaeon]
MSRTTTGALWFAFLLLLLPLSLPFSQHEASTLSERSNYLPSANMNESANFTSAGASGVALIGEPAHVGDILRASILVSNSGSESGLATLNIEDAINGITYSGDEIEISPGSSREVNVDFSPQDNTSLSYNWWLTSPDSHVDSSMSGVFTVEVYPSQSIIATVDSHDWDIDGSLSVEISMFLSSGRTRNLVIQIAKHYQGTSSILQSIPVELDPGRRSIIIDLGNLEIETLSVELIPIDWVTDSGSTNSTIIYLESPSIETSTLSIDMSLLPTNPVVGEKALVSFSLSNEGENYVPAGKVRLILPSDGTILSESSTTARGPGETYSSAMEIPSWPNAESVDIEIVWMVGDESITSFASIDSKASNDGSELPFDVVAAFYGVLAGIATVLAGRLAWRTVSSRAPSTSESGLRLPRAPRVSQEKQEKKEVSCPYCEQRLKVPANHFGGAKCPACTMQFKVEEETQPQFTRISVGESTTNQSASRTVSESSEPVSRSSEDLLQCPDCDQTLRVPMDKRPVKSRCPVCKLEFMAKSSEE